jgi:poly(3-hydroxyalkanoate) synthetase
MIMVFVSLVLFVRIITLHSLVYTAACAAMESTNSAMEILHSSEMLPSYAAATPSGTGLTLAEQDEFIRYLQEGTYLTDDAVQFFSQHTGISQEGASALLENVYEIMLQKNLDAYLDTSISGKVMTLDDLEVENFQMMVQGDDVVVTCNVDYCVRYPFSAFLSVQPQINRTLSVVYCMR